MKTNFTTLLLLFFSLFAQSQNTTIGYLDINNVKAAMLNRGDMFWSPDSAKAQYEFPKGSGRHSNFAGALWVAGIEQNSNMLHVSAQTYRQNGNDYWPGPIYTESGAWFVTIDSASSEKWDKIWKVNKTTIDSFIQTFPHTVANTPAVILQWPAKGNIYAKGKNGDSIFADREMAPFVDVNNDGNYSALSGDYPKIKGEQAIWWVFNDFRQHDETNSTSLNLEVKAMAFACNSNFAISNTIFVEFKITSYNINNFYNARVSFRNDMDIGFAYDDYIGCDTTRRMAICYNGDNDDETVDGYGLNLTQTGCIMLKSPLDTPGYKEPLGGFVCYDNSLAVTGNPYIDTEYYSYMNNRWKDGQQFTDACNARSAGNLVTCVYPSEPSDITGWSEKQCNNPPGGRRIVLNSGSFILQPGNEYDFEIAVVNTPLGSSNLDFSTLRAYADTVVQFADGCSSSYPLEIKETTATDPITVTPNPSSDRLYIHCNEKVLIRSLEIYSVDGKLAHKEKNINNFDQGISIRNLKAGLYYLKIFTGKNAYVLRVLKF